MYNIFVYVQLRADFRFEWRAVSRGKKDASQHVRVSKCKECKVRAKLMRVPSVSAASNFFVTTNACFPTWLVRMHM